MNAMINPTGSLLNRLSLENCHRSIVEEYKANIGHNIIESQREMLEASGKGPAIPFVPPWAVEELLASRGHRTWCLKNINLLAPITTSMWKAWENLSDAEIKVAEDRTLSCANILKEPAVLANAFPLALFDNHKCTTTKILLHAKQDMLTCNPRHKNSLPVFGMLADLILDAPAPRRLMMDARVQCYGSTMRSGSW